MVYHLFIFVVRLYDPALFLLESVVDLLRYVVRWSEFFFFQYFMQYADMFVYIIQNLAHVPSVFLSFCCCIECLFQILF